jgi:hypothetical protein
MFILPLEQVVVVGLDCGEELELELLEEAVAGCLSD